MNTSHSNFQSNLPSLDQSFSLISIQNSWSIGNFQHAIPGNNRLDIGRTNFIGQLNSSSSTSVIQNNNVGSCGGFAGGLKNSFVARTNGNNVVFLKYTGTLRNGVDWVGGRGLSASSVVGQVGQSFQNSVESTEGSGSKQVRWMFSALWHPTTVASERTKSKLAAIVSTSNGTSTIPNATSYNSPASFCSNRQPSSVEKSRPESLH